MATAQTNPVPGTYSLNGRSAKAAATTTHAGAPTTSGDPIKDAIAAASGDIYVPSTLEVRDAYINAPDFMPYSGPKVKGAEFDAWLAQIRAEAREGK